MYEQESDSNYSERKLDSALYIESIYEELNSVSGGQYSEKLKLAREGTIDSIIRFGVDKKEKLLSKVKYYRAGYDKMNKLFQKLPREAVLKKEPISFGGWITPLLDDFTFAPLHLKKYVDSKLILKDLSRELLVITDKTQETGLSKLVAEDKFKRVGIDKATAQTIKKARWAGLKFVSGELVYILPGSTVVAIYHNKNGTYDVVWKQTKYTPDNFKGVFNGVDEEGKIPPVSHDDYGDYLKLIRDLLSIYSARLRGHTDIAEKIEDIQDKVSTSDGKEKKMYIKELSSIIKLEEAITADLKRSIEGLLKYMEHSRV